MAEIQNNDAGTLAEDMVPALLSGDSIIMLAREAEMRIAAVKQIKALSLAVTNAHDWTDQAGKPYLQVSGAEKVARLFGISWRVDEPKIELFPDGHYQYTYTGEFSLKGASIEAMGSRSSRDPFFSSKTEWVPDEENPTGEKKKVSKDILPEKIDRTNVQKSAYTNLLGNGITRLLGIRNLTWEELEAAGIKRAGAAKVRYDGKKGDDNRIISEAQAKRLYAISKSSGMDEQAIKQHLLTEYGLKSSKDIPVRVYEEICAWVQRGGGDERVPGQDG